MEPRRVVIAVLLLLVALPGPLYWLVSVTIYPTPDANTGAGLGMLSTLFLSLPAVIGLSLIVKSHRRGSIPK
jgi:hypothetical protein